jgi:hypothetical protein
MVGPFCNVIWHLSQSPQAQEYDLAAMGLAIIARPASEGEMESVVCHSFLQLAMEAEAAKGRMEAELLQVSKIATGMEARLRDAQAAAESARTAAATADRRAYEAGGAAFTWPSTGGRLAICWGFCAAPRVHSILSIACGLICMAAV